MIPDTFLAAVLERPQDDAPRLRLADWLDDRCDPLGEFIRVQCRLAGLPADHPAAYELETRQRELLAEFGSAWVGDLAGLVHWWTFRRGFIEEISLDVEVFLEHGPELFRLAPIQEVHFSRVKDRLPGLAQSQYLRRTSYLDLSDNPVRDPGAKLLAASPHLARVRGLNLSSSGVGDAGLKALATSPHLKGLRELYLGDNRIGDAGARALAFSPLAARLEVLHLRHNAIGSDGAQLLQGRLGERVSI